MPFEDDAFSAVAMAVVFFLRADPVGSCASAIACYVPAVASRSTRPDLSCKEHLPRRSRSQAVATSTPTASSLSPHGARGCARRQWAAMSNSCGGQLLTAVRSERPAAR